MKRLISLKTLLSVLVFLFFISMGYALNLCQPDSIQELQILVKGYDNQPVENAEVYAVYFQSSTITPINQSDVYAETKHKFTDINGRLYLNLVIKERDPKALKCKAKIYVKKMGYEKVFEVDLRDMPLITTLKIPFAKLYIKTVRNNTIIPAKIIIGNFSYKGGFASESVPLNTSITGYAVYNGAKRFFNITIENATTHYISFNPQKVSINVKNSYGDDIPFSIVIGGKKISGIGGISIDLPYLGYSVRVEGDGFNKTISIYSNKTIIIDREPPIIAKSSSNIIDDKLKLVLNIFDKGPKASGILKVNAYVNNKPFPIKMHGDFYTLNIPLEDGELKLKIIAVDNAGNKAIKSFDIKLSKNNEIKKQHKGGLPGWVYIAGAIVGILIIIFIYFKFKEGEY